MARRRRPVKLLLTFYCNIVVVWFLVTADIVFVELLFSWSMMPKLKTYCTIFEATTVHLPLYLQFARYNLKKTFK
jgi:hypothetical protein